VVRYRGARYHSSFLNAAPQLVGRKVFVMANSDQDLREIECALDDGSPIGKLQVERRWRGTPHSAKTRQEIKKLENKGVIPHCDDIVAGFRSYLESNARTSKLAATKLARLAKEQAHPEEQDVAANPRKPGESSRNGDDVATEPVAELPPDLIEFLNRAGTVYR